MKIVFATGNKGKLKEVKDLFKLDDVEIVTPAELGFVEEIEENGDTFEKNAFIQKHLYIKHNFLFFHSLQAKPSI